MVIYGLNNFIKQVPPIDYSRDQKMLLDAQMAGVGADLPFGIVATVDFVDGNCARGDFVAFGYSESGLPIKPHYDDELKVLNAFRNQCASLGWKPVWEEKNGYLHWKV
jgi:hypothetical protein